ncbi:hypothetical protein [Enterococcus sp. DIV0086]|uniref:hypothetical protein n=1 Tax=Enterococcus sp. DIV0086 TaxID=2774655 RepID=UPI003D2C8DB0
MKKLLFLLASLLFLFSSVLGMGYTASATEVDDMLNSLSLTGDELDAFEKSEQIQFRSMSPAFDDFKLRQEYDALKASGALGEDVTYDMYVSLATTPPPTDPVAPEFRNRQKRGISDLAPGDILVTNGTSLDGAFGHAGIYAGNGFIMSIQGIGYKPAKMHIMQWMYYYNKPGSWTKVYRPAPRYNGSSAAEWSINHYDGKDYSYMITTNIFSENPTYCSKIVWQSYWYASGAVQVGGMYQPVIAQPYDLPDYFDVKPTHTQTWKG